MEKAWIYFIWINDDQYKIIIKFLECLAYEKIVRSEKKVNKTNKNLFNKNLIY